MLHTTIKSSRGLIHHKGMGKKFQSQFFCVSSYDCNNQDIIKQRIKVFHQNVSQDYHKVK